MTLQVTVAYGLELEVTSIGHVYALTNWNDVTINDYMLQASSHLGVAHT